MNKMTTTLTTRKSQFALHLTNKVGELSYFLEQISNICEQSRQRFESKEGQIDGQGQLLNYQFSAFTALAQTLKDILPVLTDNSVSWGGLAHIRHIDFIKQARNAITHDGNSIITLWSDGRYYVPCDIYRIDDKGNAQIVRAPTLDIGLICSEFTFDLSVELLRIIEPLIDQSEFSIPPFGFEFFDQAIMHPAVSAEVRQIYLSSIAPNRQIPTSSSISNTCDALEKLKVESTTRIANQTAH